MARIAGITIEKDLRGHARYARIDMKKYGDRLKDFFNEVGVKVEPDIKLTSKLKKSIQQARNGESKELNPNNIWE